MREKIIVFLSFFIILSSMAEPISLWHADGNAIDSVGGNSGTLQNGASYTTGKFGMAFSMDGLDDYITTSTTNLPIGTQARSISIWFKTNTSNKEMYMFAYGTISSGAAFGFGILAGNLMITQCGQNLNAGFVADNQFHHGVVTYSANTYRLYVDGNLVGSNSMSTNTQTSTLAYIGAASTGCHFQGLLDEISIYDYAMTSQQVSALYNSIPSVPEISSLGMILLFSFFFFCKSLKGKKI